MGTVPLSVMESTMRVFKEFDEIKAAVGTEVGVSNWIEVTQERIEQFAQATGDNQWIHVDVERAERELPMGTTIAHGLLTLSVITQGVGRRGWREAEGSVRAPPLRGTL